MFNCFLDLTTEKAHTSITTINNRAQVQNPKTIGESEAEPANLLLCRAVRARANGREKWRYGREWPLDRPSHCSLRFSESFGILPSYGAIRPYKLAELILSCIETRLHTRSIACDNSTNTMGQSPETPTWKRHCAIAYPFDLSMPQVEIARRLDLTTSTVHNLVQAARARSPTSDLADAH